MLRQDVRWRGTLGNEINLPLVSIGIPTYNRPAPLRRTLACITGQTYPNLQIIISDNASTDPGVAEVVHEFLGLDNRIQYFCQSENRGPAFNFQFVREKANGEYFMWAADDDWRDERFIEELLSLLIYNPTASIAFCNFQETYESGQRAIGYPDHLRYLKPFTIKTRNSRCVRYFMQNGHNGKANIIYGLFRYESIKSLDWNEIIAKHGFYGIDMLIIYKILQSGPLVYTDHLLYKCTVDNLKYYQSNEANISFWMKFFNFLSEIALQVKSTIEYLKVSSGVLFWAILLFLPLKLLQIIGFTLSTASGLLIKRLSKAG